MSGFQTDSVDAGDVGVPGGVASLDGGGKHPVAQIPAVSLPEMHVVADAPARLALTVQEGDEAKQLDNGQHYIYDGTTWYEYPANTDENVKVTANDTTAAFLKDKLVSGYGTTLTELNDGADEDLEIKVFLSSSQVLSVATDPITSGTDVQVNSMVSVPGAGTYLVLFSTSSLLTDNGSDAEFSIYANSLQIADSLRSIARGGNQTLGHVHCIATQGLITVTAGQAIEIKASVSAGTLNVFERTLTLLRVF